jgi:hypothetical protein
MEAGFPMEPDPEFFRQLTAERVSPVSSAAGRFG